MVASNETYRVDTSTTSDNRLTLPVDVEHGGIRTAGCLSFTGVLVICFIGFGMLFGNTLLLAGIAALIAAAAASYGLEYFLKRRWPSGRIIIADSERVELRSHETVQRSVDAKKQVNVLTWYFKVKRGGRVKKGWYVVGLSLEQDDTFIPIYTFASPKLFEEMPLSASFTLLEKNPSRKEKALAKNMRRAGEQRRLHEAEQERGYNGAEVSYEQFLATIEFLRANYPTWMTIS